MIEDDMYLLKCQEWPHAIGYSESNPDFHTYIFYVEDKLVHILQIPKIGYHPMNHEDYFKFSLAHRLAEESKG